MSWGRWLGGFTAASAGLLLYGALVEVDKLVLERRRLWLPHWPEHLDGFRLAFLTDLHLRDKQTVSLAERAVAAVLGEAPDMVALGGDFVSMWKPHSEEMLYRVLEPLLIMQGGVVAVPGNRDYYDGNPSMLQRVFDAYNITLLRNQAWTHFGVSWVGIDSANMGEADPLGAFEQADEDHPKIVLWHEPDLVGYVPEGASLMLSGHSHGGQFTTPWGWAPVTTRNGREYLRGYFPNAPTPLYVSRGLGTTGPPSRLFCRPEATILTLYSM
ncbi:MAG: metallophosphoesterase [Armatimonadetes bacterium]|nr:metallophosphoesterase [Armatimonadota bacterium]